MKQLIARWAERWEDWKAQKHCRRSGHRWVDAYRVRLVRLTDDPWLEYIDGLPAGKSVSCRRCGTKGVETSEGVVARRRRDGEVVTEKSR